MPPTRSCIGCGTIFVDMRWSRKRYCSRRCWLEHAFQQTTEGRLLKHSTIRENGCIEWTGKANVRGYGIISLGRDMGRRINCHQTELVHRLAWRLKRGDIPDGKFVCHHCDNPPCWNFDHLFLGTHQDNMDDMRAKRRGPKSRKLDAADFMEIQRLLSTETLHKDIARQFNISQAYVSNIAHGRKVPV